MRGIIGLLVWSAGLAFGSSLARGSEVETDAVEAPDGVRIVYDVRGQGEPTLVFLHCWACDRQFWREQTDEFARDYRVVTLDMAGHGESGTDRQTWSIRGLAGDVKAVVDKLDLKRVILIGHSMGGPVAMEAALLMPGRVIGVVGVDTLKDADFAFTPEMAAKNAAQFETDFAGAMQRMVAAMFPPETDPSLVEWVRERACKSYQPAAVALMKGFADFKLKDALTAVKVPVRVINAAPRRRGEMGTAVETNRHYGDFDAVLMEGVGHYPQLQKPAEFNEHLRTIVQGMAGKAGTGEQAAEASR